MSRKKNKGFGVNCSPHSNKVNQPKQPITLGGIPKKCDCKKSFSACLEVLSHWYATLTHQDFDSAWIDPLGEALSQAIKKAKTKKVNFAIVSFGDYEWLISQAWYLDGAKFETSKFGVAIRGANNLAANRLARHLASASNGGAE